MMNLGALGGPSSSTTNVATGRIVIDTTQIRHAVTEMQRYSKQMAETMVVMNNNVVGLTRSLESMSNKTKSVTNSQKEFLSIQNLIAASFAPSALKISNNFARLEFIMKRLVGNQKDAQEEMRRLKAFSEEVNQPYEEILHSATTLLPLLKGTNVELQDAVSLAIRLSELDPMQGISGASIAIREFLSGEYLSLVRRFELDRSKLREIVDESGNDPVKRLMLLNQYMTEIGYGPDMLKEMEAAGIGTFDSMTDSIKQMIDKGFRPLRDEYILPTLRFIRDMAREMDKLDPAFLTSLVGAASILSAGSALRFVPALAPVANAAVPLAAGYGAVEGTIGVARIAANQGYDIGGLDRFKGKSQDEARDIVKKDLQMALQIVSFYLLEFAKDFVEFHLRLINVVKNMPQIFVDFGNLLIDSVKLASARMELILQQTALIITTLIDKLFTALKDIKFDKFGVKFEPFKDLGDISKNLVENIGADVEATQKEVDDLTESFNNSRESLKNTAEASVELTEGQEGVLGMFDDLQKTIMGLVSASGKANEAIKNAIVGMDGVVDSFSLPGLDFTDKQVELYDDYLKKVEDLEENSNEKRLEAESDFTKDMAELESEYQEDIKKKTEDFNLTEKRNHEDYLRDRQAVLDDSDAKEQNSIISHYRKVEEIQNDARDKELEATQDYWDKIEELTKQYYFDLSEAAGDLDVSKVISLQRKFTLDRDNLTDSYNDELSEIEATRIKRIEEEKLTLKQISDENRKAREEKLKELDEEERIRKERAAEDFRIEQERMAEEHNQEMDVRRQQYDETLKELQDNLEQQKQTLLDNFIEAFNDLVTEAGQSQDMLLQTTKDGARDIEAEFRKFWKNLKDTITNQGSNRGGLGSIQTGASNAANISAFRRPTTTFATGGRMFSSGLAFLENDEHILRPDAARMARSIFGSEITPGSIQSAFNSRQMQFHFNNENHFGDIGKLSISQIENLFDSVSKRNIEEFLASAVGKI